MEPTENNSEDTKPSFHNCPSCKSDSWKSAKMVVMEGITVTKGTIEGTVTDPGRIGGNAKSIFLADRWFSLDHKLQAEIDLVSSSGLVEGVRKLMLAHGAHLMVPPVPQILKRTFSDQLIDPKLPSKPSTDPVIPNAPVLPSDQPWYVHFGTGAALSAVLNLLFGMFYSTAAWVLFIVSVPVIFARSFKGNVRQRETYADAVENYPALVSKTISDHKAACEKYGNDLADYHHKKALLADYQGRVQSVLTQRELLWENSRVCMRCGTAFINKP